MSAVPKRKMTAAEYLVFERAAEWKHEFYNGEVFAMAGASRAHNIVLENISIEIGQQLKGSNCRSYSSDLRVQVERTGLYTYPDYIIVCGKEEYESVELDTLLNPLVILEVLSKSTESYNRGAKFNHYQKLESLREYVLVSQNQIAIDRFVRQPDGRWEQSTITDPAGELILDAAPVRVAVRDLYRGVDFAAASTPLS